MSETVLKICGLTNREDAECAGRYADYLGFVLHAASPRRIDFALLEEMAPELFALRVAVVVDPHPALVRRLLDQRIVDIVQLHGNEPPEFAAKFDRARIWKAVHLSDRSQLADFARYPADRMVLDAPCGGSGLCCDWELAREAAALRPCLLAGGITPANAAEALERVGPWGLDTASGVERSPGIKDHTKIKNLAERIQS